MKEETTTTTPSRFRVSSKVKEPPKPGFGNGSSSPALKARSIAPPDMKKNDLRIRRVSLLTNSKSGDYLMGSQKGREVKEVRVKGRPVNHSIVDQVGRPKLQRHVGTGFRANGDDPDGKTKELQEKLALNENLVKDLQAEILGLKMELDKVNGLNMELQSQKMKLSDDLAAAESKIAAISSNPSPRWSVGEYQSPKFKDIQKLIANKLEISKVTSTLKTSPPKSTNFRAANVNVEVKARPAFASLPPPPPPPLPLRALAKASSAQKAPTLVKFCNPLGKQDANKDFPTAGNHSKQLGNSAHNSIVGEIQNRSSHLLAIKMDIESKGDFINGLIQKVLSADYTDIEQVLKFMDWLDSELSTLADERAVLKHFKWPERKADAMREAAIEYRELKLLENEILSYKDINSIPCEAALKKIASLLDKSEKSTQRLIKLRNSVMGSYKKFQIPTDWMLDSGIMSKIKQGSMKLARMYMKRLTVELESNRSSDRESNQEALLLRGLHFAHKTHQFAGGLDSETLCTFEDLRQRLSGHLGGSQEILAATASSRSHIGL